MDTWLKLLNKTINELYISDDKTIILFITSDGESIYAYAAGECCNYVYLEHIEGLSLLLGNSILQVSGISESSEENWKITLSTSKGQCDLEVRNLEQDDYAYGGSFELDEINSFPERNFEMRKILVDF